MASYSTREESVDRHRDYFIDTEEEGKYLPWHWGYSRAAAMLEKIPSGSVVLEMGCNSGGLTKVIMDHGCLCYGVDVAIPMVLRAEMKGIRARVAPAEDVPFSDEMFDVVIASELLEHVYDPQDVLKEAWRVLKPGGLLIGTVPHDKAYNSHLCKIEDHVYHTRIYTRDSLVQEISKRMEDVKIEEIQFHKPPPGTMVPMVQLKALNSRKPQWFLFTGRKPS